MDILNNVCKTVGVSVVALVVMGVLTVLAIDAYEYEVTGECRDCVILNEIRDI